MEKPNLTLELDAQLMYSLKEISIKTGTNCAYMINAMLYNIVTSFKTSKLFKGLKYKPTSHKSEKKHINSTPDIKVQLKLLALENGTTLTNFINATLQRLVDVPYSGDTDEELVNDYFLDLIGQYQQQQIIDLLHNKQK